MATKPVFLLGAGASIDAGLPDSSSLTEAVYQSLKSSRAIEAELFAFVIAKLIVRQTRRGSSPFERIDIESAYDALKRLLAKDSDILSEFVSGWDILLEKPDPAPPAFSVFDFERALKGAFQVSSTRSLTGTSLIKSDSRSVRKLAEMLSRQFRKTPKRLPDLSVFTEALSSCLTVQGGDQGYLSQLAHHCRVNADCVGTLNYDLLLEDRCKEEGIPYGYGLKSWNLRRFIKFGDDELRLVKLHGSLNWYFDEYDAVSIMDEGAPPNKRRALVFGGQADKLEVNGPFLALRHEFFRRLRQSTILVVAGYSFRDHHINSLLKSWILTKRNGKIIVVSPNPPSFAHEMFAYTYRSVSGKVKRAVEVKLFKERLGLCVAEVISESEIAPMLTRSDFSEDDFRHQIARMRNLPTRGLRTAQNVGLPGPRTL